MSEEEKDELFKKCFVKTLKKLAEEPDEVINYNKLLKKYNNLLKEKIKQDKQLNKQKEVIDKIKEKVKDLYSYADNEEYVDNYCKEFLELLEEIE